MDVFRLDAIFFSKHFLCVWVGVNKTPKIREVFETWRKKIAIQCKTISEELQIVLFTDAEYICGLQMKERFKLKKQLEKEIMTSLTALFSWLSSNVHRTGKYVIHRPHICVFCFFFSSIIIKFFHQIYISDVKFKKVTEMLWKHMVAWKGYSAEANTQRHSLWVCCSFVCCHTAAVWTCLVASFRSWPKLQRATKAQSHIFLVIEYVGVQTTSTR